MKKIQLLNFKNWFSSLRCLELSYPLIFLNSWIVWDFYTDDVVPNYSFFDEYFKIAISLSSLLILNTSDFFQ